MPVNAKQPKDVGSSKREVGFLNPAMEALHLWSR
jgi:hypothetical protein